MWRTTPTTRAQGGNEPLVGHEIHLQPLADGVPSRPGLLRTSTITTGDPAPSCPPPRTSGPLTRGSRWSRTSSGSPSGRPPLVLLRVRVHPVVGVGCGPVGRIIEGKGADRADRLHARAARAADGERHANWCGPRRSGSGPGGTRAEGENSLGLEAKVHLGEGDNYRTREGPPPRAGWCRAPRRSHEETTRPTGVGGSSPLRRAPRSTDSKVSAASLPGDPPTDRDRRRPSPPGGEAQDWRVASEMRSSPRGGSAHGLSATRRWSSTWPGSPARRPREARPRLHHHLAHQAATCGTERGSHRSLLAPRQLSCNSRLATLTQARSSRRPTVPQQRQRRRPHRSHRVVGGGIRSSSPRRRLGVLGLHPDAESAGISRSASTGDTPGARRAMVRRWCLVPRVAAGSLGNTCEGGGTWRRARRRGAAGTADHGDAAPVHVDGSADGPGSAPNRRRRARPTGSRPVGRPGLPSALEVPAEPGLDWGEGKEIGSATSPTRSCSSSPRAVVVQMAAMS